jgi:replicative DNA helicase
MAVVRMPSGTGGYTYLPTIPGINAAANPHQVPSPAPRVPPDRFGGLLALMSGICIENRVQEVSYISCNLKMLARNSRPGTGCRTGYAIEQRADKEPQLSDLRRAAAWNKMRTWSCSSTAEMYDKDTLRPNVATIKVAKHRNGPIGNIELIFRSNLAKFENAATRQVDQLIR